MSEHRLLSDLHGCDYGAADPGDAGLIVVDRQFQQVAMTSGGSNETRTVEAPAKEGLRLLLFFMTDGGGDIVVTFPVAMDQGAHTTATFNDAKDVAEFVSIDDGAGGFLWRCVFALGVTGPVFVNVGAGTLLRSYLVQDDLAEYPILAEAWYLWDSTIHAPLGATALSADDLIYTLAAFGTGNPVLTGTDPGGGTPTQYAQTRFRLPPEYVAGESISIAITGFTGTTLADDFSKVDLNVYRAAAPTVDICATAEQSINSLTPVTRTFVITPTDCVPGDILNIKLKYAGSDAGNLGTMVPTISDVKLLLDIKG